jgi:hypothetical protein
MCHVPRASRTTAIPSHTRLLQHILLICFHAPLEHVDLVANGLAPFRIGYTPRLVVPSHFLNLWNNAIARRLARLLAQHHRSGPVALPLIDTVGRLQGTERHLVLFSLTTSNPAHLDSAFLNQPNRFNVAIHRARHKLVGVGRRAFFPQVPPGEPGLQAHHCLKAYYHLCHAHGALFFWNVAVPSHGQ